VRHLKTYRKVQENIEKNRSIPFFRCMPGAYYTPSFLLRGLKAAVTTEEGERSTSLMKSNYC
jgi:hypothetical protein